MTYKHYSTGQGDFCIDWDTCCQVIRSYHRSAAQLRHSKEVKESKRSKWNPLSWSLPDLSYIEVDWDAVRRDAERDTLSAAWRMAAFASFDSNGIDKLVEELQSMQEDTRKANGTITQLQSDSTKKTMAAMSESIAAYQSKIDVAKIVRDISGSVLVGAATVATGGATGVALLGGSLGTGLKTVAKYQDTGSLGVATVEAVQGIIVCLVPAARGVKLSGAEVPMKVLLSVVLDADKAVLAGAEVLPALNTALVSNLGAMAVGKILDSTVTAIVGKAAIPVSAKLLETPTRTATQYLTGSAKKAAEDLTKNAIKGRMQSSGTVRHELAKSQADANSWDSVLSFGDRDELLLKFAIVDMNEGIGRSWW
jgi:hypothetical protein